MNKEVVVTGIGILTPLGVTVTENWNSLINKKNGIVKVSDFNKSLSRYGVHVIAPVPDFDLSQFNISKKLLRNMNYVTKMFVYAALKALQSANISYPEQTELYKVGAVVGCGTALDDRYHLKDYTERHPMWFFETFPNLMLSYLSIIASIKGYGCTLVNACSTGNQAIGHAYMMIQSGRAKILLAGAAENKMTPAFISGFSRLNMTTPDNDPETASRPFDRTRNGFVIGKGACVLVLEEYEHALKRGVHPFARILGYGAVLDGMSIADANEEGKVQAMQMALEDAHILPTEIDYINAHGTSTQSNDLSETIAIKKVFNEHAYKIPVNSTKSMMGHTFSASGLIEAAVSILSLMNQKVHATCNFLQGCEVCDLDYVKDTARDVSIKYCLNNSSGIGGYNSSLIIGRI